MNNLHGISKFASSVGFLIDRCVRNEEPFGTVWLVDENTAVTCAHLVVLYADFLSALKVRFPSTNQEWEISEVRFHEKFDRKSAAELAQRSLFAPVPALALQDQNLAVLKLSRSVSSLSTEAATMFNRKLALQPAPRMKGLCGSVDELGLAMVLQTVTNARKDGVLFIADERNRPVAKLFCREGKVLYARYGKLRNEQALFQMFSRQIFGQFSFRAQSQPDFPVEGAMERTVEGLLLEAHRRMDEMPKYLDNLGGQGACYSRAGEALKLSVLPEELQADARAVWRHLDGGIAVDQLWEVVDMDDHSIYRVLNELRESRQVVEVPDDAEQMNAMAGIETAPHMVLNPWDEVAALSVHPVTGRAQIRRGAMVGLLRPNDPYHLLHTLNLPYRMAGAPIFKGGQVIGMHCGMLPLDPTLHALPTQLHQLLWVESIRLTLENSDKSAKAPVTRLPNGGAAKASVKLVRPRASTGAISRHPNQKLTRICCHSCGSQMQKLARFCGACGKKIVGSLVVG